MTPTEWDRCVPSGGRGRIGPPPRRSLGDAILGASPLHRALTAEPSTVAGHPDWLALGLPTIAEASADLDTLDASVQP